MLFAQSSSDAAKMLSAFISTSADYGLKVHAGKTKLMTWDQLARGRNSLTLNGTAFTILSETDAERYLGRKLSFHNCHSTELQHRVAAGWAKFQIFKSELTGPAYSLRSRLQLFESVISTTVLFGCCTWALTKLMTESLDVLRRRMLRYVLRIYQRRDQNGMREDWSVYMQRCARLIEDYDKKFALTPWACQFRAQKWRFAGSIARAKDNRWSNIILDWAPCGGRSVGRPCLRWQDDIAA